MKYIASCIILVCAAISLGACSHTTPMPEIPAISFSKEVLPIFLGNCTQSGCHGSDINSEAFPLTSYDNIVQNGIIPRDAVGSSIYQSISGRGLVQAMPPSKSLAENDLQSIYIWIQQGAKNN